MGPITRKASFFLLALTLLCFPLWQAFAAPQGDSSALLPIPKDFSALKSISLFSFPNDAYLVTGTDGTRTFAIPISNGEIPSEAICFDFSYTSSFQTENQIYLTDPYMDEVSDTTYTSLHLLTMTEENVLDYQLYSAVIPNVFSAGPNNFCVSPDSYVYLLSNHNRFLLSVYQTFGDFVGELETQRQYFLYLLLAPDGGLYAAHANIYDQIGYLPTGLEGNFSEDFPLIASDVPQAPCCFLDNNLLIDKNGDVFERQEDGSFQKFLETDAEGTCATLTLDGILLCRNGEDTARTYEGSDSYTLYRFDGLLTCLASSDNSTVAVVESNGSYYFYDLDDVSSEVISDEDPDTSSDPEPEPEPEPDNSWDSIYPIDPLRQSITIPAGLSFAEVKKGFTLEDGYSLKGIRPNGSVLTSGYVGTGAIIELYFDDEAVDSLTVIALGDLDGTGTATTTDVNLFYDFLNGYDNLDDNERLAADLTQDGNIGVEDLLFLKKQLNTRQESD